MLRALKSVHQSHPSLRILWKVIKCEGVKTEDLSFVRQVDWLPSVKEVYSHPAVKVVVHHGGGTKIVCREVGLLPTDSSVFFLGSTANEVIYHGLRHLVIPQWSDTYDWAA